LIPGRMRVRFGNWLSRDGLLAFGAGAAAVLGFAPFALAPVPLLSLTLLLCSSMEGRLTCQGLERSSLIIPGSCRSADAAALSGTYTPATRQPASSCLIARLSPSRVIAETTSL